MIIGQQHLVIFRTGGSIIDIDSYNCQEIGLAKSLAESGMKVTVILGGLNDEKRIVECGSGATVTVIKRRFKAINQSLAWFYGAESLLSELKPTHIQIHEFGMFMSWRVVRWAKKHKVTTTLIQGSYEPTHKPVFRQLEQMFNFTIGRHILKSVDSIGCKTTRASEYVSKYCHCKTILTPVGLDVSKFTDAMNVDWHKSLDIGHNDKILLYVGKLEQRRNPLFLIEVIRQMPENYKLVVVGDGVLFDKINGLVNSDCELRNKVRLTGKISQTMLPSLYEQSDMFLLASDFEIFGMVILESMFFGLPVISTRTAGSETLINHETDGFIIDNLDIEKWCETIKKYMSDIDMQNDFKHRCRDKIKNTLTWERAAKNFIKAYSTVE